MEYIWLLLGGVVFCLFAIRDFRGSDRHIQVKYRNLPGRAAWQRRQAILETVIGVGAILSFFATPFEPVYLLLAILIIVAFVMQIVNNQRYTKQAK